MDAANAKEKVLVIAPCPFFIDRGTPIRIKRLAATMAEEFDVHVASFHQGRDGDFPFRIHRTPRLPFSIRRSGANFAKIAYDFLLLFVAIRVARREKIELIDGHLHEGAFIGLVVGLFTGARRVIYNAHGTFVAELIATGALREGSILVKPLAAFELWVERRVDGIVAQSRLRRDEFIARGHPPEKITVVEDVPELDDLHLAEEEIDRELEKALRPEGEKLLIYSGGMEVYQGVDYLMEAFRELCSQRDDVRLVLFGRPLDEYRTMAAEMGISGRISFVEDAPFERLPQYLAICDLGFALRLYGENVPGKLPIYMASGIAVVGTDAKGINTVIEDGVSGVLVPTDDVPRLASKISELLDDPGKMSALGRHAREEAVSRYSVDAVRQELGGVYRDLLAA